MLRMAFTKFFGKKIRGSKKSQFSNDLKKRRLLLGLGSLLCWGLFGSCFLCWFGFSSSLLGGLSLFGLGSSLLRALCLLGCRFLGLFGRFGFLGSGLLCLGFLCLLSLGFGGLLFFFRNLKLPLTATKALV